MTDGAKSDYSEKIVLDMFLGGQTYTPPDTIYVALSTAAYDDAATGAALNEVAAGLGYDRIAVTNDLTNWPAATGTNPSQKSNGADIAFGTATGSWGNVQSAYLLDAADDTANVIYGADLLSPTTVGLGSSITILAGTYIITED